MGLYIYQYSKVGSGEDEYIVLSEEKFSKEDIKDNKRSKEYSLDQEYDTDTDTNFCSLPTNRPLFANR